MVKNPPVNAEDARDPGLIPGSGRSPGIGSGNTLQYSCLENCMDRGAWWAIVHGATKTRLNIHSLLSRYYSLFADITLQKKVCLVKTMASSPVGMWELDYKESWALKNWCFWTVVLEKTLESPLDCKEIQPVHSEGNQSWAVITSTDAEAEAPKLWSPDAKNWLIGKDPDAGKDWRQKKGTTEDEMVGWHHQLNGHEFEQALGVGDGQGGLACCSPRGHKESDTTKQLNWTAYSLYRQ